MIEEWFCNEDAIKDVKSPTMIIHGKKDLLIPCAHGETIFQICSTRKLFINPQLMEHNTNLTSDISYLIVPMFRFFALPDYSFKELKIPAWAFDKRRSPLYVRPDVQVASHTAQAVLSADQGTLGTMSVPLGDDFDLPIDRKASEDVANRAQLASGDTSPVDYEKFTVLTHPTVLHSYSATKQRYIFQDPNGVSARASKSVQEEEAEVNTRAGELDSKLV